jgi:hypothetical protein
VARRENRSTVATASRHKTLCGTKPPSNVCLDFQCGSCQVSGCFQRASRQRISGGAVAGLLPIPRKGRTPPRQVDGFHTTSWNLGDSWATAHSRVGTLVGERPCCCRRLILISLLLVSLTIKLARAPSKAAPALWVSVARPASSHRRTFYTAAHLLEAAGCGRLFPLLC